MSDVSSEGVPLHGGAVWGPALAVMCLCSPGSSLQVLISCYSRKQGLRWAGRRRSRPALKLDLLGSVVRSAFCQLPPDRAVGTRFQVVLHQEIVSLGMEGTSWDDSRSPLSKILR